MAKEELFKVPILKNILENVHTFPVKRGASDRAAIKTALQMLEKSVYVCFLKVLEVKMENYTRVHQE
jgi:1-acyl-sn-glycerol-3-phosphate acyltransferase